MAQITRLTHQGYPGRLKPSRQLQASSDMFFDVFREFDPGNLLLTQASREVMDGQLEIRRLRSALEECGVAKIRLIRPPDLTPLSFPLWAESLRPTTTSSETWEQRVRRMVTTLEARGAAPGRKRTDAARV